MRRVLRARRRKAFGGLGQVVRVAEEAASILVVPVLLPERRVRREDAPETRERPRRNGAVERANRDVARRRRFFFFVFFFIPEEARAVARVSFLRADGDAGQLARVPQHAPREPVPEPHGGQERRRLGVAALLAQKHPELDVRRSATRGFSLVSRIVGGFFFPVGGDARGGAEQPLDRLQVLGSRRETLGDPRGG